MARRASKPARDAVLGDWSVAEILPPHNAHRVMLYSSGIWACACKIGERNCAHIRRCKGIKDNETIKLTLNGIQFSQPEPSNNNPQPSGRPRRVIDLED